MANEEAPNQEEILTELVALQREILSTQKELLDKYKNESKQVGIALICFAIQLAFISIMLVFS